MIWRECTNADHRSLLRLTREPMSGKIRLAWGFETLTCPTDCAHFKAYCVEDGSQTVACAIAWDWPGGHRYLSGLRFSQSMKTRPRPQFWKTAFSSLLQGVDHAWTSIGRENHRARRILESGASWLPHYEPRQEITTWFVPMRPAQAVAPPTTENLPSAHLTSLHWRHIRVASGSGFAYGAGRVLDRLGLPGIPRPDNSMRIGHYRPPADARPPEIKEQLSGVCGYDGIIVVLPSESDVATRWREAAPLIHWEWLSTLYSVSWSKPAAEIAIPEWEGYWL